MHLSLAASLSVRPISLRARLACACFLVFASALTSTALAAPPVGQPAPDFALRAVNGEVHRLSEHFGEVVLINFWVSWAGPSRQEMPELDELYAKYRRAGLVMFGVNLDDDSHRAGEMAESFGLDYPTLLDAQKAVAKHYDVSAMPLTVLVDREGVVRFVAESYKPGDEKRYAQEVRKLLNE